MNECDHVLGLGYSVDYYSYTKEEDKDIAARVYYEEVIRIKKEQEREMIMMLDKLCLDKGVCIQQ